MSAERYQRIFNEKRVDDSFIKEVLGSVAGGDASLTPITKGESNAVFLASTPRGRKLIVRHHFDPVERWFVRETAVLAELRTNGLPVPEVLTVRYRTSDEGVFSVCVQEPLAGDPYLDLLNAGSFDHQANDHIMRQVRQVLTSMHSTNVTALQTEPKSCDSRREALETWVQDVRTALSDGRLPNEAMMIVDAAVRELFETIECVSKPASGWAHGDFHPKHVFVAGQQVTGVIDFETANADDPARDLAWWSFWRQDPKSATRAYPQLATPSFTENYGDDVAHRMRWYELETGISTISFYLARAPELGAAANAVQYLRMALQRPLLGMDSASPAL